MKLSFKIFIISFLLVTVLMGSFCFIIIKNNFNNELNLEKNNVKKENEFLAITVNNLTLNDMLLFNDKQGEEYNMDEYIINMFQNIKSNNDVFIGREYSLKYVDKPLLNSIAINEQISRVIEVDGKNIFVVLTRLNIDGRDLFIEHLSDLSSIYIIRKDNYHFFILVLLFGSFLSSGILFAFSTSITKPLVKLSSTSKRIANGNFNVRNDVSIKQMKSEEVLNLAVNLNFMTDKIEEYVAELQSYNERQDEFISRFTHELKTPLTSIIGYADILRSQDMEPKKRGELVTYIYKEGKRLEDLTFHLLKLILLKNEEFEFKEYNSRKLFKEISKSVAFLVQKYEANLTIDCEEVNLFIEPVLLKSLLYNLIDNACKNLVNNKNIFIVGKCIEDKYLISVEDNGKGIEKGNIDKVLEPFFMEDKSRARRQGGAGLGLSLVKEIARIHNSGVWIQSELGKGTKISLMVGVIYEK